MSDTETRPTPKAIADAALEAAHCGMWVGGGDLIHNLAEHGYRIVHPDDVPLDRRPSSNSEEAAFARGWNNCRILYFGGADNGLAATAATKYE